MKTSGWIHLWTKKSLSLIWKLELSYFSTSALLLSLFCKMQFWTLLAFDLLNYKLQKCAEQTLFFTSHLVKILHSTSQSEYCEFLLGGSISSLTVVWISYGYRGRDCRSNLYLLPTGEIVYFNASVVVLYNTEEQQQRHYLGHNDDVKWWADGRPIMFVPKPLIPYSLYFTVSIKCLLALFADVE